MKRTFKGALNGAYRVRYIDSCVCYVMLCFCYISRLYLLIINSEHTTDVCLMDRVTSCMPRINNILELIETSSNSLFVKLRYIRAQLSYRRGAINIEGQSTNTHFCTAHATCTGIAESMLYRTPVHHFCSRSCNP